jgi:DNA-binding transcriptional regulator YiaG
MRHRDHPSATLGMVALCRFTKAFTKGHRTVEESTKRSARLVLELARPPQGAFETQARALAGLTQKRLATELKVNERAVRFWERKHDRPPTSSPNLRRIEEALQRCGVTCFAKPTPGVRLAEKR